MSDKPYIVYYEALSEVIGFDGAAICSKVLSMANDKGEAEISLLYLCKIGHMTKGTLKRLLLRLQNSGYISFETSTGKGHLTKFVKGSNLIPFEHAQKGTKCVAKRVQNEPLKIDNINRYKDRYDKRACARINQSKEKFMNLFEQFWQAFFFGTYAQYEDEQLTLKERCAKVFALMPETKRAALIKDMAAGKRYDKTHYVLWYLQHYEPGVKKGTRLTRDQYYAKFGDDLPREGWRFYKPAGYERFIYEKV